MDDWMLPGVSLAIIKDGKLIMDNYYGFADLEENIKVSEDTLFETA